MAVISGRVLEYRPFSEKTTLCRGWNSLSPKAGGSSSLRINVWQRRYSSNSNESIRSDSENGGEKVLITRGEDVSFPSDIDRRRTMRWWLPLYGWFQADQERWADVETNEWKTEGKAMHKGSDDDEEEIGQVSPKRSKFVKGRLTPEKAKILRKNLRETSRRRDIMYHSAIASRLASPDTEVHT